MFSSGVVFGIVCLNTLLCLSSGVDFQMKSLVVDGEPTLLQLWDTAGQERCVCVCVLKEITQRVKSTLWSLWTRKHTAIVLN